jgi:hypothetical protein
MFRPFFVYFLETADLRQHRTKTACRLCTSSACISFRHIAPKLLGKRQLAVVVLVQSDEKSDFASDAQSLSGVALTFQLIRQNF